MIIDEDTYLRHYGILRRSGRYPWGSGDDPYQRSTGFLSEVAKLREEGMSDTDIAKAFGISTTKFRELRTIARAEKKAADIAQIQRMKEKGMSQTKIAERMGRNESSIRALLKSAEQDEGNIIVSTKDMLKEQVEQKGIIDIGRGVELYSTVGVSRSRMNAAIAALQDEGYNVNYVKVPQIGTGKMTTIKVLYPPDMDYSEVYKNRDSIKQIEAFSDDGGRNYTNLGMRKPENLSSDRIKINYAEDGGADADGVMYLRPGVSDLSLGNSRYAQVRIAVDGTHYLKGMAMYKSDLPKGVDVVFNTNKTKKEAPGKLDAMKKLGDDPDNPFGAVIRRQKGVLNILDEEGGWGEWSKSLSSQMLSKQSPLLAKTQLDMKFEQMRGDFDEIRGLTNPVVRRKLLMGLSDDADASAVHLKAAHLPRQAYHVILPVNSLKPTEIYAPNYRNGERVVLIRHPHGGIFEIPELTVNNRHPEGQRLLGKRAKDAVGINAKVAERLSGADFDGDTVLVIPNNSNRIKTSPALEGLKNFDPRRRYPEYEGMKVMTPRTKQFQMGDVSNLITDMTIKGASQAELARAVRHSMVVIDAEKHKLNYKQSAIDNGIPQLKEKYQGGKRAGASTVVSRSRSTAYVPERKDNYRIDPTTGRKIYTETGATYVDRRTGKTVRRFTKSSKMAEVDDAFELSSGTPIETVYATHANRLKSLANQARREMVNTPNTPYSSTARVAYKNEVDSLDSKLRTALRNAPRERQAQVVANSIVRQKMQANPDLEPDQIKKLKYQALAEARVRTGAGKQRIDITPGEWNAIQAGAISSSKLEAILNNTDLDKIKELATPRTNLKMTDVKQRRAEQMARSGFTQAEIADALGVSSTTISRSLDSG